MTINWKGDQVKKRVKSAVASGLNQTTFDSVKFALKHHPSWKYQSGIAEGSLKQFMPFATPKKLVARWGSDWSTMKGRKTKDGKIVTTNYVWYLEFNHPPFLRAAADVVYKDLIKRIRNALTALRFSK